jgi:hypothetical protein
VGVALTCDLAPVALAHAQRHGPRRGGVDGPAEVEHPVRRPQGVAEVALDLGQRRQEQVAEGVPLELGAALEAVVEEPPEGGLVVRQRRQAVDQIAGGRHVEGLAQAPRRAPVVADGHHGREVRRGAAQAAQQARQAGAAAERDDVRPLGALQAVVQAPAASLGSGSQCDSSERFKRPTAPAASHTPVTSVAKRPSPHGGQAPDASTASIGSLAAPRSSPSSHTDSAAIPSAKTTPPATARITWRFTPMPGVSQ